MTAVAVAASAGCASHNAGNGFEDAIAAGIVTNVIAPPLELALTVEGFRESHARWPTNFAELRSFSETSRGLALTNYDRADFTQEPDGSLQILAVGAWTTNRMTLHLKTMAHQ